MTIDSVLEDFRRAASAMTGALRQYQRLREKLAAANRTQAAEIARLHKEVARLTELLGQVKRRT